MAQELEEIHKCGVCHEWCWLHKNESTGDKTWVCPACGFRERRQGPSFVEERFERRGRVASAWDKQGGRV